MFTLRFVQLYSTKDKRFRAEGQESETRRFPFKLAYPLCFVEYNCTISQGEYLCNE